MSPTPLKLRDWVNVDKLDLRSFSGNPNAIEYLKQNPDKIDWKELSGNENAIELLKQNTDKIDWKELSGNKNAIELLEQNKEFIHWDYLSYNPGAVRLLEQNIDKIDWVMLCGNPNAIHLIDALVDRNKWRWEFDSNKLFQSPNFWIYDWDQNAFETPLYELSSYEREKLYARRELDWNLLCSNQEAVEFIEKAIEIDKKVIHNLDWRLLSGNPSAVKLLEKYPDRIYWDWLSRNPNAIHLLERNLDKIDWDKLSYNPAAIHLLEKNPDKINWHNLTQNTSAVHLLEKNLDKVVYPFYLIENPNAIHLWIQMEFNHPSNENYCAHCLSCNPHIFTYDYEQMKQRNSGLPEELAARVFTPSRLLKLCEVYGLELEELQELY